MKFPFRGTMAAGILGAMAALAAATPWSGNDLPSWAVVLIGLAAVLVAGPRGKSWWPWLAVVPAWVGLLAPAPGPPPAELVSNQFEQRSRTMLELAQSVAENPLIGNLVIGTGATLDPSQPFDLLARVVAGKPALTIYLADERGRLVAWGGRPLRFPEGLRPLGPRRWDLIRTAGTVTLALREPLLHEGRLAGSVIVAERSSIAARDAFGFRAPPGWKIRFAFWEPGAYVVESDVAPGIELPVTWEGQGTRRQPMSTGFGWACLGLIGLLFSPALALPCVLGAFVAVSGAGSPVVLGLLVCLGGATIGRLASGLRPLYARLVVGSSLMIVMALCVFGVGGWTSNWLPEHLLQPGAGVAWLVAAAWVLAAWPVSGWGLERRLAAAFVLAAMAVVVSAARPAVELLRWSVPPPFNVPEPGVLDLRSLVGEDDAAVSMSDLASVLALEWGLDQNVTGAEVLVFGPTGDVVSIWGELGPAGDRVKVAREWTALPADGSHIQLRTAEEPWSLLGDWPTRGGLDSSRESPMWWVVLSRSGAVAASLHSDVTPLGPARAGALYHRRGGWTWMEVGGVRHPARVVRERSWLVARVAPLPSVATWVVRGLLAVLWVLVAMVVARPPGLLPEGTATFGGRLRLLVAGAVIVPLAALALVLQVRISGQEAETERSLGLEAFRTVRYTAEHLGGVDINDDFARWLAMGWGGEIVLFDGIEEVAASRPDLMDLGRLPGLPLVDVFPLFLLGREDVVVRRWGHEIVAAGAVTLNGRRMLLQLFKEGPYGDRDMPRAVDWLFGGAIVAALLALALAGRIEKRLSQSLTDLVGVSRRLLDGEPLGAVARPRERDLAEVLEAVETMSQAVQEREASLKDQEEMLRITLANLEPAVLVLDEEGRTIFANPSGEQILKDHPDVIAGRNAQRGAERVSTLEIVRPDPGRDLSWRVGLADVPLPGGRRGRVIVIEDITEVMRADRLEQLTHMARIVAHEVKNPLTPIRLWVQELQESRRRESKDLGSLVDQAAAEILVQTGRLQETANAFSNLVALEQWEPERFDLGEVATEAVGHLDVLHRRGGHLRLEIEDPGRCWVTADVRWVRRAVDTVLLNSMTVIDHHSGEIIIRTRIEGSECVLEVEDDGGGVEGERFDDLFAPHFSAKGSGTGLGLALVRQVVSRAHGVVDAANGPRGLVVRMRFPAATDGEGLAVERPDSA
ncbi:MAG: hypothetical protein DRJ65_05745 [Acidobacteria bacterium]|nr:MAG: hypothetical protein DRJ65_05745 [Acidobacteriota bacterium]